MITWSEFNWSRIRYSGAFLWTM